MITEARDRRLELTRERRRQKRNKKLPLDVRCTIVELTVPEGSADEQPERLALPTSEVERHRKCRSFEVLILAEREKPFCQNLTCTMRENVHPNSDTGPISPEPRQEK